MSIIFGHTDGPIEPAGNSLAKSRLRGDGRNLCVAVTTGLTVACAKYNAGGHVCEGECEAPLATPVPQRLAHNPARTCQPPTAEQMEEGSTYASEPRVGCPFTCSGSCVEKLRLSTKDFRDEYEQKPAAAPTVITLNLREHNGTVDGQPVTYEEAVALMRKYS